jgi:8-oxo-dGTP diphosphatase
MTEVALAVATCELGVLFVRRSDGRPPVALPGGKRGVDESAAAAALREVREETGLLVVVDTEIGQRVHPVTGQHIPYLAARPVDAEAEVVPASREVRAVYWADLNGRLPSFPIYTHVRGHLVKVRGEAIDS